jgi:hypothetical protein
VTVGSQHWAFQYDAIGNRIQALKGTNSTTYQLPSGSLRDGTQYASIGHPSVVDVSGQVNPSSPVSISMDGATPTASTAAATMGEAGSYYREFSLATAGTGAQARWVKMHAQTGSAASLASRDGWYFYRGASETFTYDLDGNLTSDARWTYTWDAENRLASMVEKVIPGPTGRPCLPGKSSSSFTMPMVAAPPSGCIK